jgi:hypothetical protein
MQQKYKQPNMHFLIVDPAGTKKIWFPYTV